MAVVVVVVLVVLVVALMLVVLVVLVAVASIRLPRVFMISVTDMACLAGDPNPRATFTACGFKSAQRTGRMPHLFSYGHN